MPVRGEDRTKEASASSAIFEPAILHIAVLAYFVALPVGQFIAMPINGTMAAGSDVFLAFVLLAAIFELIRVSGPYFSGALGRVPLLPVYSAFHLATFLMIAFSTWVALSALWGFHPSYAITKGLAFGALSFGALAIFRSGTDWGTAADAWLCGTLLCLVVTWLGVLVGSDILQTHVLSGGWSIGAVALPRLSGPFPNANMFGDYLVVSGAILWARWDTVRDRWGRGSVAAKWLLGVTLFMTVSTAWLGAGVLLAAIGLLTTRQRDGVVIIQKKRPTPVILLVAGVVVFTMTVAGLLLPMSVDIAGFSITGSGIRPGIWSSALEAFKEAPVGGVGASPYLASAADPFDVTAGAGLWDAHNIYLSILGQFGLLGAALLAGAVMTVMWTLVREGVTRRHAVLLVALLAAGVHGIAIANEEFRHLWALLGLVGLAGVPKWAQGQWWKGGQVPEPVSATGPVADEAVQE